MNCSWFVRSMSVFEVCIAFRDLSVEGRKWKFNERPYLLNDL